MPAVVCIAEPLGEEPGHAAVGTKLDVTRRHLVPIPRLLHVHELLSHCCRRRRPFPRRLRRRRLSSLLARIFLHDGVGPILALDPLRTEVIERMQNVIFYRVLEDARLALLLAFPGFNLQLPYRFRDASPLQFPRSQGQLGAPLEVLTIPKVDGSGVRHHRAPDGVWSDARLRLGVPANGVVEENEHRVGVELKIFLPLGSNLLAQSDDGVVRGRSVGVRRREIADLAAVSPALALHVLQDIELPGEVLGRVRVRRRRRGRAQPGRASLPTRRVLAN